jgi:YVTN family beta-propeller protein
MRRSHVRLISLWLGMVISASNALAEPERPLPATNIVGGRLLIVNRSTGEVCAVTVPAFVRIGCSSAGNGPHRVAVHPDGDVAYVPIYGIVPKQHHPLIAEEIVEWERGPGAGLSFLNVDRMNTFHRQRLYARCKRPYDAATDGVSLWISCEDTGVILQTGARDWSFEKVLRSWKPGKGIRELALSPDNRTLAAANRAGTVALIDPGTDRMKVLDVGARPGGMAFAPDGKRLFVLNAGSNTFSVIDMAARKVVKTLATGGRFPAGIAVSSKAGEIWISHNGSNDLTILDLETLEEKQRIKTRWRPLNLILSDDEQWAFVTVPRRNEVWAYDTATRERRAVIPDMMEADGLAFVPAR